MGKWAPGHVMLRGVEDPFEINPLPEYREAGVRLTPSFSGYVVLCLNGFALQLIEVPGLMGYIDSASITPNAARNRGLDFDYKDVRTRAVASLAGAIANGLSELARKGFPFVWRDFVGSCVQVYGEDVLLKSEFPFVQALDRGGAIRFFTRRELDEALLTVDDVFVGIGSDPNETMMAWHRTHPKAGMAFCFPESLGYRSSDAGALVAPLRDLLRKRASALFHVFLGRFQVAWSRTIEELLDSAFQHRESIVYGTLSKAASDGPASALSGKA